MTLASTVDSDPSCITSSNAPLLARQDSDHSSLDTLNTSHGATLNCYGGGTWVPQTQIASSVRYACGNLPCNYVTPPPLRGWSADERR